MESRSLYFEELVSSMLVHGFKLHERLEEGVLLERGEIGIFLGLSPKKNEIFCHFYTKTKSRIVSRASLPTLCAVTKLFELEREHRWNQVGVSHSACIRAGDITWVSGRLAGEDSAYLKMVEAHERVLHDILGSKFSKADLKRAIRFASWTNFVPR